MYLLFHITIILQLVSASFAAWLESNARPQTSHTWNNSTNQTGPTSTYLCPRPTNSGCIVTGTGCLQAGTGGIAETRALFSTRWSNSTYQDRPTSTYSCLGLTGTGWIGTGIGCIWTGAKGTAETGASLSPSYYPGGRNDSNATLQSTITPTGPPLILDTPSAGGSAAIAIGKSLALTRGHFALMLLVMVLV